MESTNKFGRQYRRGKALSEDFRRLIIDRCIELGGNKDTCAVPTGTYTKISKEYKISDHCVRDLWLHFCSTHSVAAKPHGGGQTKKLSEPDVQYLLALKTEKPTISYSEMRQKLLSHSDVPGGNVSLSMISNIVTKNFNMSFKKVSRPEGERFSADNLRYTQAFIDHMQTLDPNKVLYMDESGYKTTVMHRNRGHSEVGVRCIEVTKYHPCPHLTLNLLVGLRGPLFYNFVDGSSTMAHYVQFFTDASHAYADDGLPVISPGDVIVVDNSPLHHNQAEVLLHNYFAPLGVQIIFMPRYSPDLSPAEPVFMQTKTLLKQSRFSQIILENFKVAIGLCLQEVTAGDMLQFYRHTGIFNV